jgi:predicted TIM-barrel fold metal-dependent hydrolase
MSGSCGAPDSEVRRKLMRGAIVAGSAPTLAGCDWIKKVLGIGPALSPGVGPPGVDAHCHIFNIRDMPAYAFVIDVVVENPVLKPLAAPVAKLFVEICRAPAKTYEDEKSVLTAVLANPLQPMPAVATAAEIDFMIAGGLARYVTNFTSIGKNAPPTGWTPDFDLLIAELFKTYLPGVIDPTKTPAQNALAILANLQTLAVNMSAPVTPAVSFGAYAAQFFRKWAPELAKYRFQIAEDAANLYGGSVPLFLAPATLDIVNWLPNAKFDDPPTPLAKQAELMSLISLVQPANRALHGFIGFDPWRQVVDEAQGSTPTALDVVKTAVETQGFIGVKIYPPMGFRATDNALAPQSAFAGLEPATIPIAGRGAKIDDALMKLYTYCNTNDVPIMAHCAPSQGPTADAALQAHPQYWKKVMDLPQYKSTLRVNLGHFGGVWSFDGGTAVCWTKEVAEVIQGGSYGYLYADFGDFANILNRDPSDRTAAILGKLTPLLAANPAVRNRLLYGTDFHLLGREPGYEAFYAKNAAQMQTALGVPDLKGFLGGNAVRFLGLEPGKKARARLEKFYTDHMKNPAKLAQFA